MREHAGERCPARTLLEFDHIDEVARGGEATTTRMRLRCRAHNQYEAERTFGTEFMQHKRDEARRAPAERRAATECATAKGREAAQRPSAALAAELELLPCLKHLGFRTEEARLAIRHCETFSDAPIEERLRAALKFLAPIGRTYGLRQAGNARPPCP